MCFANSAATFSAQSSPVFGRASLKSQRCPSSVTQKLWLAAERLDVFSRVGRNRDNRVIGITHHG
jgi:hypothetical protein